MFLGHFAVGLGAKRAVPSLSLGLLFAAAQFADLLWPNLILTGVEQLEIVPGATAVNPLRFVSYPWSHSLLTLFAWGLLLAGVAGLLRFGRRREAFVVVALVVSHWLLDFASHVPDMPLTPAGDTRLGLGLWRSLPATLAVELFLLAVGSALYLRSTRARDRIGSVGLGVLLALLVAIYVASLVGPPPPSPQLVAWSAQAIWLIIFLGWWVDRHREPARI